MRLIRILKRCGLLLVTASLLLTILAIATSQGRAAVKTGAFVLQVLPDAPVKPLTWFTAKPIKEEITFPRGQGEGMADLYIPHGTGARGAMLLFLGVNPAGRGDDRVVNLAEGLARSGFVVMVPWSEAMAHYIIEPREIDDLVHAFEYLRDLDFVDKRRVGIGGFCVGASIATVAAQDYRIREQVAFINFFGGYFDVRDLLKAIASHTRFGPDGETPWLPSDQAWKTFRDNLIHGVGDSQDQEILIQTFVDEVEIPLEDLEILSHDAKIVYQLLKGVSLEEAEELLDLLPKQFQETLTAISPSENLSALKAKMLIMHDQQDNNVPADESRRFRNSLKDRGNVHYTEFVFFHHMDPTRALNPLTWTRDVSKLFLHLYRIISIAS